MENRLIIYAYETMRIGRNDDDDDDDDGGGGGGRPLINMQLFLLLTH